MHKHTRPAHDDDDARSERRSERERARSSLMTDEIDMMHGNEFYALEREREEQEGTTTNTTLFCVFWLCVFFLSDIVHTHHIHARDTSAL